MPPRVQMSGLCRFSYLFAEGTGFARRSSRDDGGYDEARLDRRLALFEAMCAPALAAQTDMDFTLLILIGRALPPRFKDRLAGIVRGCPQFVIREEAEGQHHLDLCRTLLLQHRDPACEIAGEFRMDDDDAVAVDFIAASRGYADQIAGLVRAGRPVELDFCSGLALKFDGPKAQAKVVVAAHWSCAQVFFNLSASGRTAFHHHHYKSWQQDLCLTVPDRLMFLRGFHGFNDSGLSWDRLTGEAPRASHLSGRFGFDLPALLA